ncbi:hydrolase [Enterococcus haemoperoxidus ATCC BAA-382]|uniref:Hydrolase n=1 Tax=Enterococcus haemoperoxidus ATCC BAA-382 TaxID=1158608 RepID=R2QUA4_9ENTE|nr:alpha/beta fold hydrolase [Enterococcus haemoperoxidus]EOI00095.1 hydrolase [Enterococcus haemoperoxidus ATCC BAA-382]EOT63139.1 hydrolase [Enterococcus haemoperoxidus ATCC BAA-382]OJG53583.1 hydrolase [Enterococcus haemoperoxidus]
MKISIRHRYIKKIPVLEVVPEKHKNSTLPLVIYYHGWQSAKELSLTQARKLAKKGIRVILPDAMNHGERKTGPISPIPSVTFWSSIQYNIIEFTQLVRHFEKQELIDSGKIGVGGVSMGGITTCALLTQHPEIKTAACMMGTPAPQRYIERVMERSAEMDFFVPRDLPLLLSWVAKYDLSEAPEKLAQRPVLFWHGTKDPKIPYEDMAEFYQMIEGESYAENSQFITGEGEGHLVKGEMMDVVAAFFEKELFR